MKESRQLKKATVEATDILTINCLLSSGMFVVMPTQTTCFCLFYLLKFEPLTHERSEEHLDSHHKIPNSIETICDNIWRPHQINKSSTWISRFRKLQHLLLHHQETTCCTLYTAILCLLRAKVNHSFKMLAWINIIDQMGLQRMANIWAIEVNYSTS